MLEKAERHALVRAVLESVRDWVAPQFAKLLERLTSAEAQIRAVELSTRSAPDLESVRAIVIPEIRSAIEALPPPKDGKDASPISEVTLRDQILLVIRQDLEVNASIFRSEFQRLICAEVAELPTPKDGKDSDPEQLRRMVNAAVGDAISAIPTAAPGAAGKDGRDGIDVDMVEVRGMVKEMFLGYPVPKDGLDGKDGRDGKDGEPGQTGPTGESITGERGLAGIDGKDPDPALIRELVDSAVADAVLKIPAAIPGAPGKDAEPVHPDTLRLMIVESVRQEMKSIQLPKDGEDGHVGRDALEIDILPAIDSARSYPRGTFASHEGGLIRAIRNTEPITQSIEASGWAVVIEGFSDPQVTQAEDLRSFTVTFRRTAGSTYEKEFRLPALIYRGIYQDGTDYSRGDTVTWAGSVWHCQSEITKAKPGEGSADWRLMVKQGRPGKDAEPKKQ